METTQVGDKSEIYIHAYGFEFYIWILKGLNEFAEVDPENPEIIVEPGKDGECSLPPITIPVLPGRKKNISVTFRLESHPLDVYYLMDFSGSMRDDKANLVKLSSDLVAALKNMTKDFHLGFGSFVDKPIGYLGGKGE